MAKNTTQFNIEGAEELDRVLKHLPSQIQKQVTSSALRAGGQVLRKAARRNVLANGSYETGNLYRAIKVGKKRGTNDIYRVGVDYKIAPHAHLVEYGTSPRKLSKPTPIEISPGKWVTVQTTGSAPAKPFMRPAFDENWEKAAIKIVERLRKGIIKQSDELAQRYGALKKATKRRLARS